MCSIGCWACQLAKQPAGQQLAHAASMRPAGQQSTCSPLGAQFWRAGAIPKRAKAWSMRGGAKCSHARPLCPLISLISSARIPCVVHWPARTPAPIPSIVIPSFELNLNPSHAGALRPASPVPVRRAHGCRSPPTHPPRTPTAFHA